MVNIVDKIPVVIFEDDPDVVANLEESWKIGLSLCCE